MSFLFSPRRIVFVPSIKDTFEDMTSFICPGLALFKTYRTYDPLFVSIQLFSDRIGHTIRYL